MGVALGVLGLEAFSVSVLFFVALWVIRAADYFKWRESTVELVTPRESFWDALQIVLLVLGLVGLFFVFWLLKRMLGAAGA